MENWKLKNPNYYPVSLVSMFPSLWMEPSFLPYMRFSKVPLKVKSKSEFAQLCPTLCDSMDCSLPGSFIRPWDFPGKSTGVGCHFLLQGDLPDPEIEPGSPTLLADAFTIWATREVRTWHGVGIKLKAEGIWPRVTHLAVLCSVTSDSLQPYRP